MFPLPNPVGYEGRDISEKNTQPALINIYGGSDLMGTSRLRTSIFNELYNMIFIQKSESTKFCAHQSAKNCTLKKKRHCRQKKT